MVAREELARDARRTMTNEGYTTNAPVDDVQGGVSSSSRTFAITDADVRAIVSAALADA